MKCFVIVAIASEVLPAIIASVYFPGFCEFLDRHEQEAIMLPYRMLPVRLADRRAGF